MSRSLTFALLFLSCVPNLNAQKFGYIDLSYILGKMPAYAEAQNEINTLDKPYSSETAKEMSEKDMIEMIAETDESLKKSLIQKAIY